MLRRIGVVVPLPVTVAAPYDGRKITPVNPGYPFRKSHLANLLTALSFLGRGGCGGLWAVMPRFFRDFSARSAFRNALFSRWRRTICEVVSRRAGRFREPNSFWVFAILHPRQ